MTEEERLKKEEQADKQWEEGRTKRDEEAKKIREERVEEEKKKKEKEEEMAKQPWEELTLCRDNLADMQNRDKNPYYGATVGRTSGRIQGGLFTLKGTKKPGQVEEEGKEPEMFPDKEIRLQCSDVAALNHLHGGMKGFDQYIWEAEVITQEKSLSEFCNEISEECNKEKFEENEKLKRDNKFKGIKFTRVSADREENYPGEVNLTVYYMISNDDKILIHWEG